MQFYLAATANGVKKLNIFVGARTRVDHFARIRRSAIPRHSPEVLVLYLERPAT
jgi:hypothetical protein